MAASSPLDRARSLSNCCTSRTISSYKACSDPNPPNVRHPVMSTAATGSTANVVSLMKLDSLLLLKSRQNLTNRVIRNASGLWNYGDSIANTEIFTIALHDVVAILDDAALTDAHVPVDNGTLDI